MHRHINIISFLVLCAIGCNYQDNKSESNFFNKEIPVDSNYTVKYDTMLFFELKKFFFTEIGHKLHGKFYSEYLTSVDSVYYLTVSFRNRIETPPELILHRNLLEFVNSKNKSKTKNDFTSYYIYCGKSMEEAKKKAFIYQNKGYHTNIHRSILDSRTLICDTLLSFSNEDICIIVFHELMHNYIFQRNKNIPYDFNEATCDVVGHYLALKFAKESIKLDTTYLKNQILTTEKIYNCINEYTQLINNISASSVKLNNECQNEIRKSLSNAGSFINNKFEGNVNNAYLLSHMPYCKNYFLIKELYLKQSNTKEFIDKLYKLIFRDKDIESYLNNN